MTVIVMKSAVSFLRERRTFTLSLERVIPRLILRSFGNARDLLSSLGYSHIYASLEKNETKDFFLNLSFSLFCV